MPWSILGFLKLRRAPAITREGLPPNYPRTPCGAELPQRSPKTTPYSYPPKYPETTMRQDISRMEPLHQPLNYPWGSPPKKIPAAQSAPKLSHNCPGGKTRTYPKLLLFLDGLKRRVEALNSVFQTVLVLQASFYFLVDSMCTCLHAGLRKNTHADH